MPEGLPRLIRKQPVACCVVCGGPLLARQLADARQSANPFPACETVACRMIVSRRSEMSEAGFKHYLQIEANQTQWRLARAELMRTKDQAEAQENAAAWAALRLKLRGAPRMVLQLRVPTGPARARKLSPQRREVYRAHLAKIIDEALSGPGPGPEPLPVSTVVPLAAPLESSLPGRLCAFCGGGCCTRGGDKAYLTAETVRRVLAAQPEFAEQPEALIAAYMDRLPAKSQTGSCVNHGPQGCGLSREMRSDICNNYACEPLGRLLHSQLQVAGRPQTLLVLRRSRDNWQRPSLGPDNAINAAALLSEDGSKRFTPAALLGSKPSS